jgi:hypothetical protein
MARPIGCGNCTIVGPLRDKPGTCGHARLLCRSLRCLGCSKARLRYIRSRITLLAELFGLFRVLTLTLNPTLIPTGVRSDLYLKNCWRKMRVLLQRRFGASIRFIAILEFQKSGLAHLHVLVGLYIPQDWLSEAWQSIGGGKIVDIRCVDASRVAAYVTPYLVGGKIHHTLSLLPARARIFSTSRGLSLSERKEKSGWWVDRVSIETVRRFCPNASQEKFEEMPNGDKRLSYFEGLPTVAALGDLDAMPMLKRLARAWTKGQKDCESS